MKISVIICTHNPRPDYMSRVLQALREQTFPPSDWELVLVDNRSSQLLSGQVDLSWHPHGKHVREEMLGLTSARLCGIETVQGELLIFVDDDNVLNPDYLEACADISLNFPFLGVWGGQLLPEFEIPPPDYAKPYLYRLACWTVERQLWSNIPFSQVTPAGAGMCVRRSVADSYLHATRTSPIAMSLGRRGNQLTASEDCDLAYTACDLGLGMGAFPQLKLTHLLPKRRLEREYLLRLFEDVAYSDSWLRYNRGVQMRGQARTIRSRIAQILRQAARVASGKIFDMQVDAARNRGLARARAEIARL
jgi:glycosyltransferase involved in cell wall biosynthesis